MNYNKLNKPILVNKLIEADKKIAGLEKIESKYAILKTARKEDKEAVDNSKLVAATFIEREKALTQEFTANRKGLVKSLNEQNVTILTLFEMMDNSINQQVFYYNKFKEIYVGYEKQPKEVANKEE